MKVPIVPSRGQGRSQGGGGGGPGPPPPKSGGSQKYVRGDPCDLGSEAKNRGSGPPPRNGWGPPRNQILATPLVEEDAFKDSQFWVLDSRQRISNKESRLI